MSTITKGWITRAALPLLLLALLVSGCNKLEEDTTAASYLVVTTITGNDVTGQAGSTTIFSDVISEGGTVINDTAVAILEGHVFDPFDENITAYKDIIVDRVDIEYTRSDGLNTEGVDVPYGFSQAVNVLVPVESGNTELAFVIVSHNAKLESPLVGLTNIGGEKILKLEAHCTFYGHTLSGHEIAPVTHTVSVWCANFGDDEE